MTTVSCNCLLLVALKLYLLLAYCVMADNDIVRLKELLVKKIRGQFWLNYVLSRCKNQSGSTL